MKIILVIILNLFFLVSCLFHNCELKKLSNEEVEWFETYKLNQEILYKSNLGKIDTFNVIQLTNDYTDCNKIELSKFQYQEIFLRLALKNKSRTSISLKFTKEYQDDGQKECIKYFDVYDMRGIFDFKSDSLIFKKINSPFDKKDHLTVFFDVANTDQYTEKIKSFNWSKDLGLLRYETLSGEVFELFKVI